ncbi:MAG: methyltransferase [Spirochaetaceae bacterium]|nr:MAG: methyltransferase [Spirochaetaceae bacterium]
MKKKLPSGYSELSPLATYSPWLLDAEFQKSYELVKDNTLVDQYRCYSLWQLARQVCHLPGDILEVGVWRGGTGALLKQATGGAGKHLWLADTFQGVVKAGPKDDFYKGGEHADTSRETVESLISKTEGLTGVSILEGIFPDETAEALNDRCFCFCHIDVDVYQSAKDILEWVWPRLSSAGVVVFDDYGFLGCDGVTALGDELLVAACLAQQDYLLTYNLNGQAILVKR